MHILKGSLFILFVTLFSCTDNIKDPHSTRTVEDSSLADAMFSDVFAQVFNPNTLQNNTYKVGENMYSGTCPTATIDPFDGSFPVTVTVDFGTTNCTAIDGRPRRGILIAELDGPYREPGSTITVTTDNYHVNDIKIEGVQVVKNLGFNQDGNLHFSIEEKNGKIYAEKGIIHWNSERIREWVEGESTLTPYDDVYKISGSANGKDSDGKNYTLEIINPLRVQIGCRWITEGILDIKPENLETRTIDYGNGDCNGTAKVTVGNFEFTVVVP